MFKSEKGDILTCDVDALVNPVNCVGQMGKGLALAFKQRYPELTMAYKAACKSGELVPGRMFTQDLAELRKGISRPRYVINFPTKRHWRSKSRLEDIDAGLVALAQEVKRLNISSIAVPPLGCGLGGLDWEIVRPRIEATFQLLPDVDCLLFEPR